MTNIYLKENEVHVYKIRLDKPAAEIKQLEKLLSEDELQKSRRYRFKNLTDNYIAARGTLRKILGRYLNTFPSSLRISYKEKGKPYIEGNDLKFNLAHSKAVAVYAFTLNDEVGIDVEQVREIPDVLNIAQRFFSLEEYIALKEINKELINFTFFNCWTRKEAFIKAIGDGLSYPLEYFSVTSKPGEEPMMIWIRDKENEVGQWALHNIDAGNDYISSLSIKNKNKTIVYLNGY